MPLPMISVTDSQMPAWPGAQPEDDPILAARGVVYTVGLSLPFWLSVAVLLRWVTS